MIGLAPHTAPYTVQTADAVSDGMLLVAVAAISAFVGIGFLGHAIRGKDLVRAAYGVVFLLLSVVIIGAGM